MAIKQIYMPVSGKSTQTEMMVSPERVQQRHKQMNDRVLKGEQELNDALNNGYEIKAQYASDDVNEVGIVFVLHKFNFDEANQRHLHSVDTTRGATGIARLYQKTISPEEQAQIDAAFDEAEEYFYPAGKDDTPHCKTCRADLLYCRCDRSKS